ncbi:MAG: hypothetical protein ACOH13_09520 [Flavobacteriales bacterium]
MANKIFLLVNGPLDEHSILAAFSTRGAADAALRFGGWMSRIEEVELDPQIPAGPDGHSLWIVVWEDDEEPGASRVAYCEVSELDQVKIESGHHTIELWAKDEEHAVKLGVERIEQFKKEQGVGA